MTRRRLVRLGAGTLVGLLALLVLDAWVVFWPRLDTPRRSDALVVLGPSGTMRMETADRMMRAGAARQLVVSAHPGDLFGTVPDVCTSPRSVPYPVRCFDPEPTTTQGEARAVREMAAASGWRSVQVLTVRPQVARARLLLGRCYAGDVRFVPLDEPYSRTYQFAYQTGAWIKALASPGC